MKVVNKRRERFFSHDSSLLKILFSCDSSLFKILFSYDSSLFKILFFVLYDTVQGQKKKKLHTRKKKTLIFPLIECVRQVVSYREN